MVNAPHAPVLLYVTNPMCPWCYGFTPVVRRLRALWHGRLNVKVLLGDMWAHTTEPLQQEEKSKLAVSWHQIQEHTFQPFDYRFFRQRDYVYNTEPACRALLCVRLLRPALLLEVLRAFHSAFFVDGQDLKDTGVLVRLVGLFGIRENLFLALFESEEIMQQMEEEFSYVDSIGATTFPSALVQTGQGIEKIAHGYMALDQLEQRLLQVLEQS
ncbi:DsbA family protein [Pontibacter diazotrophicus]|uniref:DsbA family protein n=1 Tax=Pontibacter diazotrophicus TaxID=1400979 RepID=A0A3D8LFX1_9BACT|nr:DsbA family protein [Pontibacter diazotrophicus]RDV16278.1 DsbA family protein [Pontibacter diazotrophicus]